MMVSLSFLLLDLFWVKCRGILSTTGTAISVILLTVTVIAARRRTLGLRSVTVPNTSFARPHAGTASVYISHTHADDHDLKYVPF